MMLLLLIMMMIDEPDDQRALLPHCFKHVFPWSSCRLGIISMWGHIQASWVFTYLCNRSTCFQPDEAKTANDASSISYPYLAAYLPTFLVVDWS